MVAVSLATLAARAEGATDPRELKAREDFVAGRYQEALDLFAKLYAETLHPIYLRNIGRCYQNLGEPDRAISTFHDYLRKGKEISPDEHKEIEGYILEMEELKRQREASAPSADGQQPPPAAPVKPLPAASPPPATATASVVVNNPPPPPPEEAPSITSRWWFWAIVVGVVGAGVGVAAAAGAFTHTQDASCPTGVVCSP